MRADRRILVTGAGGFIGGRMVEVFHELGAGQVRASVRRWSSGARIGRLPIELVLCDVRDEQHVAAALDGVTHVVHCAVGDEKTTVEGTRRLLVAAANEGVRRFVHLSTIDVYGPANGDVDESCARARTGQAYGDMKIAAEEVCQSFASDGLPVTILRPTLVHGPFSSVWTVAYAERLQKRPWLVAESDAQGICNLVYVDDLVGATLAVLDTETPPGEAFNINGPERPTWHAYFVRLNEAMGLAPLEVTSTAAAHMRARGMQPFRSAARFAARRFEEPIKRLARASPLAREAMVTTERLLRHTPAPSEFTVYSRETSYSTKKAEAELGYSPRYPLDVALPLTGAWLRHSGYVRNGSA